MPAKKTTRTTKRAGTKKTAAKIGAVAPLPRSARQVANAIWERMKRNDSFWPDVQEYIRALEGNTGRAAQVMPREQATAHWRTGR